MKINLSKIFIIFFLIIVVVFSPKVLAFEVKKDTPIVNTEENVSLNINLNYNFLLPLDNVNIKLYKVADMSSGAYFTLTDEFKDYPVKINGLETSDWSSLTFTLEGYIARDEIEPLRETTADSEGMLSFDDLSVGLYLVTGKVKTVGAFSYVTESFMIALPNLLTEDEWTYDVIVAPKVTLDIDESKMVTKNIFIIWNDKGYEKLRPEEVAVEMLKEGDMFLEFFLNQEENWTYSLERIDSSFNYKVVVKDIKGYTVSVKIDGDNYIITLTSIKMLEDSRLPNTGQLWWPIPYLVIFGLSLIIIGIIIRRRSEDEKE